MRWFIVGVDFFAKEQYYPVMLILLSPAKTLDMDTPSGIAEPTQPGFMDESARLVGTLKRYRKGKLGKLMNISEPLAQINVERFAAWAPPFNKDNAKPAIHAFRGDVYLGLDADTLNKRDLTYAQKHVRMLSGLYGVLKPYDLMQAYRLEMGTALKTRRGKNLYDFWGDRLTQHLNDEADTSKSPLVVNLASNEYFKAVRKNKLVPPLVSPVFKDQKNGDYKVVSFFAKKARGAMARHLIQTRAKDMDAVLEFKNLGYRYNAKASSEWQPVFLRTEKAAQPYLAASLA